MNKNYTSPAGAESSLDGYFKKAAAEKVNFTQESAKSLIESHIAAGGAATALAAKFSISTIKTLISTLIVTGGFIGALLFTDVFDGKEDAAVAQKAKIETVNHIENSSAPEELGIKTGGAPPISEQKELPPEHTVKEDKALSKVDNSVNKVVKDTRTVSAKNKQDDNNKPWDKEINATPLANENTAPDEPENTNVNVENEDIAHVELEDIAKIETDFNLLSGHDSNIPLLPEGEETKIDFGDDQSTLIGDIYKNSFFGAYSMKMSNNSDKPLLFAGGKAGWTINEQLTIGGAGYGLTNPSSVTYADGSNNQFGLLEMGYGGLFFEYIYNSDGIIHFTANTIIGAGGLSLNNNNPAGDAGKATTAGFFVIEPGISVELNVSRNIRIGFESSYRYIGDRFRTSNFTINKSLKELGYTGSSLGLYFKAGIF